MANTSQPALRSLGFCTVRTHAEHGYFGGYLIVNAHARPMEFHCTLPVKPSRAQSILYGHTLADFVCGEQIAKALVSKAKILPEIVLTDCPAVLALSHVSDQLVAWIKTESNSGSNCTVVSEPSRQIVEFTLAGHTFGLLADQSAREKQFREIWHQLEIAIDLSEPFERISEALLEAHPIMKAA